MKKFILYHGTTRSAANLIKASGFIPSNSVHWLGKGVYFSDNISTAKKYGDVILQASVQVEEDNFLDCFSIEGKKRLVKEYEKLEIPKRPTHDRVSKALLHMTISEKKSNVFPFDAVRAPYYTFDQWGPSSKPFEEVEIHFVIKNLSCISTKVIEV
jgi:hypothetical protein